MIEFRTGNLFDAESEVEALTNAVNTDGYMGKGIALEFKRHFPADYFKHYQQAVASGNIDVGNLLVWGVTSLRLDSPLRFVISFPTKKTWRARSRIEWIDQGLTDLRRVIEEREIRSIAIPALGCGHGGLSWSAVAALIDQKLKNVDAKILVYGPPLPESFWAVDRAQETSGRDGGVI